jgi:eukaryotic-like serine/threonine-protein kinase
VMVPQLAGLSQAEARSELARAGLTIGGVEREASDQYEIGQVVRSEPQVGIRVTRGTPVTLWISSGPIATQAPSEPGETSAPGIPSILIPSGIPSSIPTCIAGFCIPG